VKKLFESFRRFMDDSEGFESETHFGIPFNSFKASVEKGKNVVTAAYEEFGEPLGVGSTRVVFDMGGDYVLKTVNIPLAGAVDPLAKDRFGFDLESKLAANEYETDFDIQQNFPEVFPRTYESAEDNSWLVAEKVVPFESTEKFLRYLNYHGPFDKKYYIPSRQIAYNFMKEKIEGSNPSYDSRLIAEAEQTVTLPRGGQPVVQRLSQPARQMQSSFPSIPFDALDPQYQMAKRMIQNPQMRKIIRAAVLMGVYPRELKGDNIGVSKVTNQLVMLDMSLWT
jgi:hypothetical protein